MRYSTYQSNKLNPIWIIIIINLIVFVVANIFLRLIATGTFAKFIWIFGLVPDIFWEQPWTILTSMFVHAGFGHIFGNMLTLFFFGTYLSRLVGDNKFLIVYFSGGILGSILYLLLAPPLSVAVGASGAIYAVAGVLAVMRPKLKVLLYFIIPMPLWAVVLVFFVIFSFLPNVAWQAHMGGLFVGLIAGYFYRKRERYFY